MRDFTQPKKLDVEPRSHPRRHRIIRPLQGLFGLMGDHGCGLKDLPNWMRRQHGVARRIGARLLMHHAVLIQKRTAT